MSMLGKTFLARLSHNIAIAKMTEGGIPSSDSFGGVSVIMCGNFHQFPPVAVGASEPLYVPGNAQRDSTLSQVGRAIYEEFQTVVTLKQQIRVTDEVWRDFLRHLRMGRVQQHHLEMLRTLVLTNPSVTPPDFTSPPWAHACLVTPRHAVRQEWNHAAVYKQAHVTPGVVFECTAEDSIRGQPLSLVERYAFATRGSKGQHTGGGRKSDYQGRRHNNDLPDTIEISLGMLVMVTQNVETDLDITNGARGAIVDIVLHADEPPMTPIDGVVRLNYLDWTHVLYPWNLSAKAIASVTRRPKGRMPRAPSNGVNSQ
ncbi:hypothetical protein PISMIDRAFT_17458 [Pisolithus microcarpus 441]|uniref:ATP-dependent DNA helicase n=1 Tax=Pisolithus microcarpus 441 TaxID=765257 RepID=A0A0C9XP93_9AGAM|nr:hypothetical protein PISMIDRAFT_17458 [Pisolithus microcarpus 441]